MAERSNRLSSVNKEEDADPQNLWATILSEVQSSSASKLPTTRSVVVLGDNETGKTTLIAKLQNAEEPKKGIGLEYFYLNVKDEYRDDQGRLSIWVLDGDPMHTGLLKYALTEENFQDALVILIASMSQPWALMDTLEQWALVLRQHIDRLKISPADRRDYEQSLIRFYQEYVEPAENSSTSQTSLRRGDINPLHPQAPAALEEDKVFIPLGENILQDNLGIPIVVVITKADAISTLEKEHDFKEEHFDFIQMHIRNFCLRYGAALIYTSVKEEKNCDLLHQYLLHRVYGFPFMMPVYVVEKDSVFIPTGWDNDKKIAILHENLHNMKPGDAFEDVIVKPLQRKPVQRDAEITVEDIQMFLVKQQCNLNVAPPSLGPTSNQEQETEESSVQQPSPTTMAKIGSAIPRALSTPALVTGSPKKMENEGMLANFFNSLLSKKMGAAGTPRPEAAQVHAELEKMTQSTNKTRRSQSDVNQNGPSSTS